MRPMVTDPTTLKGLPNINDAVLPCSICRECSCLKASWVPLEDLNEWSLAWQELVNKISGIESQPTMNEQVVFLRAIKSEEMAAFFRENCAKVFKCNAA